MAFSVTINEKNKYRKDRSKPIATGSSGGTTESSFVEDVSFDENELTISQANKEDIVVAIDSFVRHDIDSQDLTSEEKGNARANIDAVSRARTLTINGTEQDLSSNRSWTIPLHNELTLDNANGLSLEDQVLSLGLAGASTTGALNSTDWNIFNSKQPLISGALTESYVATVVGGIPTWNAASGGGGSSPVWTLRNTGSPDRNWAAICYGNGLFVAVSSYSGGLGSMTSPDGVNWTTRTIVGSSTTIWSSICYGNGLFVATAHNGSGGRVMISKDGINWTRITEPASSNWGSVCYGNGLFVAVKNTGTSNQVMTSPDGINWTITLGSGSVTWAEVCFGNGLFVAVTGTGTNDIITSPDGITWTARTNPVSISPWQSVCYGNGLFAAVKNTTTSSQLMTSPDGITWTIVAGIPAGSWRRIRYGGGMFVAVERNNVSNNRMLYSKDGITWISSPTAAVQWWEGLCYGNGMFVATATSGTLTRVMTLNASIEGDFDKTEDIYQRMRRKAGYNATVPQYLTHDSNGEFVWVNI